MDYSRAVHVLFYTERLFPPERVTRVSLWPWCVMLLGCPRGPLLGPFAHFPFSPGTITCHSFFLEAASFFLTRSFLSLSVFAMHTPISRSFLPVGNKCTDPYLFSDINWKSIQELWKIKKSIQCLHLPSLLFELSPSRCIRPVSSPGLRSCVLATKPAQLHCLSHGL